MVGNQHQINGMGLIVHEPQEGHATVVVAAQAAVAPATWVNATSATNLGCRAGDLWHSSKVIP
jgi:hypothetical protein